MVIYRAQKVLLPRPSGGTLNAFHLVFAASSRPSRSTSCHIIPSPPHTSYGDSTSRWQIQTCDTFFYIRYLLVLISLNPLVSPKPPNILSGVLWCLTRLRHFWKTRNGLLSRHLHVMFQLVINGFSYQTQLDSSVERYKAHMVPKDFHQRLGIDYVDTFTLVVKPTTIHTVLRLAVSRGWPFHQLDVNNAFLHDFRQKEVHMLQPPGFVDQRNHVCHLHK